MPVPVLWVKCTDGSVPEETAVAGGVDINGEPLFVGRFSRNNNDLTPGKVVPSHGVCYVADEGKEHPNREYEVLVKPKGMEFEWRHCSLSSPSAGSKMPVEAVDGGHTSSGDALYVGRTTHRGSLVIGKVHPKERKLLIPFGGNEIAYSNSFELLCFKPKPFCSHLPLDKGRGRGRGRETLP